MKIHPAPQHSPEWTFARLGLPTASEWDALVSPTGEIRTGKMPTTYLNRKIAEWWTQLPLNEGSSFAMEQGQLVEERVLNWCRLETGEEIQRVGLVTDDDESFGCSPDGLIGENGGIEIKCPLPQTHLGYVLGNKLPKEYVAQVQGSLYVTSRKFWRFVSFRRHCPNLVLTIEPDAAYHRALDSALGEFLDKFKKAKERLIDLNGGEMPARHQEDNSPHPDYHIDEPADVIP